MTKLSQKIVGKIQDEHIEPLPHWKFLFRYKIFWILFLFASFLGAGTFSLILFIILETDLQIFEYSASFSKTVVQMIPFFWIASFASFLALALWGIRHTKKGYRFQFRFLFLGNLVISIILGTAVYAIGGAEKTDQFFEENIPLYEHIHERQEKMWHSPEQGRLAGQIRNISQEDMLQIQDQQGIIWQVDLSQLPISPQRFFEESQRNPLQGRKIKIIGERTGEETFKAKNILPWRKKQPPLRPPRAENPPENNLILLFEMREAIRVGDHQRVVEIQQALGIEPLREFTDKKLPHPPRPPEKGTEEAR